MPTNAAEVEELRWKKFQVLDDGFVCLVDVMGDDQSVVQAARVSYGEGTRKVSDDRGLIRYLMRHRHSTPFEMAEIKLLVRVPMDTWRQWIRHRTANVNEYSTRYSLAIDATQETPPDAWRTPGRDEPPGKRRRRWTLSWAPSCRPKSWPCSAKRAACTSSASRGAWRASRPARICRCRLIPKPIGRSTCTICCTFWRCGWTAHAQWEIRSYATTIGEQILRPLFPLVWEAFDDYRLQGMFLTRLDREVIRRLVTRLAAAGRGAATEEDFLAVQDPSWAAIKRSRERDECRAKLAALGLLPAAAVGDDTND